MNISDARHAINQALARMNALYTQVVFDEWVLVVLEREKGALLSSYNGPRAELYQRKFKEDVQPIRTELEQHKLAVGDFVFVPNAIGTHFDACIRLGASSYLFCNNVEKSMADIRLNPLWLEAQKPFVDLSAKFRADPLE